MIPGQLNMHDIEWLCRSQTASHLHAVCEFGLIDLAAVDLYLFVNTFNWVYSLYTLKYTCRDRVTVVEETGFIIVLLML